LPQEIEQFGGKSVVLCGDVQKAHEIENAIKKLADESNGKLHILFPNAGINGMSCSETGMIATPPHAA
jgi:NADP-dependent 3-hydroxy acid dehydrogenase YdfG